jgi:hypothetical protein
LATVNAAAQALPPSGPPPIDIRDGKVDIETTWIVLD